MKNRHHVFIWFLVCSFCFLTCFSVFAEDAKIPVVINADQISYLKKEGKMVVRGNVTMENKDTKIFCQEAEYDSNKNLVYIKGDVKIVRGTSTLYGRDIVYNFNTQDTHLLDLRIEDSPFYGAGKEGEKQGQEKYIIKNGYVTTCDRIPPHYSLAAKRIFVYPEDRITAKSMLLKVGKIPIFYFPSFSQSLKDKSFIEEMYMGKSKEWGPYLLSRWRNKFDEKSKYRFIFDNYDRRGKAYGITHKATTKFGEALMKYYALHDKLYEYEKRNSLFEQYSDRENIPDKRLEDDRYKAQFSYSFDPKPNLSIKAEYNRFSDEFFMKDFFEREYENESSSTTYALMNYSLTNSFLSLLMQKRVNSFFSETEYLPQIEYNFYEQSLRESNFYFSSDNKFGNLQSRAANSDTEDSVTRVHSNNTLSYASKIKWLHINPSLSSLTSYYSRDIFGRDDILRERFSAGTNLSVKLYKHLGGGWKLFGSKIDRMRHVLTPEIDYTYSHEPTVPNSNIFQFDGDDSLSRGETITFRLKNKLQVKTKERNWDFIYFSPSVSYTINPEGQESRFTSINSDLEIYPAENFSLTANSTYSPSTRRVMGFNVDLAYNGSIRPVINEAEETEGETKEENDSETLEYGDYSISYGHRYTRVSSTQGTLGLKYQITPKILLESYSRYEYNTEDLQEFQYKIRVDLHCWWFDFGANFERRALEGSKDRTFWFAFVLKAFPEIGGGWDKTYEGAKRSYY